MLSDGELCVQDIVDAVGTSQSNVSQHLAILRDKGILNSRKEANRVFYRGADERMLQLITLMRDIMCVRDSVLFFHSGGPEPRMGRPRASPVAGHDQETPTMHRLTPPQRNQSRAGAPRTTP